MGGLRFQVRASSYEPGNRAGPVGGTNFVFCSYGKFHPGYRDEKCPKGHQNTRGTAFRPVSDLTSHAQLKLFRPGIRAGVFIWEEFEKFPARLPRSRSQKPRSRLPGQPAFSYEHIEIFVKSGGARSRKPSQPGQPGSYEEALKVGSLGSYYWRSSFSRHPNVNNASLFE